MTYDDEHLIKELLFLMRERRKLNLKIDTISAQVQKRFEEVDGLTEYFVEQSKRILDE
jgi:hypothetical protein